MNFTYTVNVPDHSIVTTDAAINLYLFNHPESTVEDALDAIFSLGVDAFIARCEPENKSLPNEVSL